MRQVHNRHQTGHRGFRIRPPALETVQYRLLGLWLNFAIGDQVRRRCVGPRRLAERLPLGVAPFAEALGDDLD